MIFYIQIYRWWCLGCY